MLYDKEIMEELITLSVEHALLKMGTPELELVQSRLKNKYNCEISDCFQHPEYLKKILKDVFGDAYQDILKSIDERLQKSSMDKPIEQFLTIMDES